MQALPRATRGPDPAVVMYEALVRDSRTRGHAIRDVTARFSLSPAALRKKWSRYQGGLPPTERNALREACAVSGGRGEAAR